MDNNQNLQTKFVVENLNKATFVGVTKVYSAIETNISFVLGNENICIYGKNLHVTKLDLDSKLLEFEGNISSIKQESNSQNKNIFKRIFR